MGLEVFDEVSEARDEIHAPVEPDFGQVAVVPQEFAVLGDRDLVVHALVHRHLSGHQGPGLHDAVGRIPATGGARRPSFSRERRPAAYATRRPRK